jgi:hypothetical protein
VGLRACLARQLGDLEAEPVAGLAPMVGAAVVSAASVIWGCQSFLECEDVADEGAASAGLVGETSIASWSPLAVVVLMKDVGDTVTAVVQLSTRMECSTWTVASDWVAGHRLAFHVDHVVVIEQMQASLTVACDKRLGESPIDSSLRPP